MKPILVTTDFSPAALSAVNYAADMALALDAALIVLHVYQVPVTVAETPMILIPVEELEGNAENRLGELKKNLQHITSNKLDITTEARLGEVAEEIEESCKKHDPFLVIMGTTGHTALERSFFGSTTLSVVKYLNWPVLAVPKGTEYGNGIHQVGLAWDFTRTNEPIPADAILSIVGTFGSKLHVLHVELDLAPDAGPVDAPLQQALSALNPTYHHLREPEVGKGIHSYAEKNNLDVLITLPKKHKFLDSLFNRSSTSELIEGSHIPVLCIHAE